MDISTLPIVFCVALLTCVGIGIVLIRRRTSSLAGEDLSVYDESPALFAEFGESDGLTRLRENLYETFEKPAVSATGASAGDWASKRARFDDGGLARTDLVADYRDDWVEIDGRKIHGRWTLVEGHDPDKRILYLHGGAFTAGSDISHRPFTVNLANRTGAAVFAPNYALMPENHRRVGIEDCRSVYHWILDHGPNGPAPAKSLALSGDSAGGNLALMLSNWARKHAPRQPDAVVAFSPGVDNTLSSPSMTSNIPTDQMLRPLLSKIMKAPRFLLLPAIEKQLGFAPAHPDISPIFEDLSGLPPTLIQASSAEMLHDDGARYAAKMKRAGSPATFQSYSNMPHVWMIFDDFIPAEAGRAYDEAAQFLNANMDH